MTIREAVTQAEAMLGTITVSGPGNIQKMASVFNLLSAVDEKLAELESKEVTEDGTV